MACGPCWKEGSSSCLYSRELQRVHRCKGPGKPCKGGPCSSSDDEGVSLEDVLRARTPQTRHPGRVCVANNCKLQAQREQKRSQQPFDLKEINRMCTANDKWLQNAGEKHLILEHADQNKKFAAKMQNAWNGLQRWYSNWGVTLQKPAAPCMYMTCETPNKRTKMKSSLLYHLRSTLICIYVAAVCASRVDAGSACDAAEVLASGRAGQRHCR